MEYSENSGTATESPSGSPSASLEPELFQRLLLNAMLEFRDGNFAVRLPSDITGVNGKIADAFNDIVALSDRRARDAARVSRMVGKEGKLRERLNMTGAVGTRAEEIN